MLAVQQETQPQPVQDELLDIAAACRFFGGSKPIHPSTLYRGIAAGRYPKPANLGPNTRRWIRRECEVARAKLIGDRPVEFTAEHTN